MRVFLDTSVMVATFLGDHPHHERSLSLFAGLNKKVSFTAVHCVTEVYSTLTRHPGKQRAGADQALLFVADVRERLTLVSMEAEDQERMLETAARLGIVGGGIYDAAIGQCALKAKAQMLYTWNLKHFLRLEPRVAAMARTP